MDADDASYEALCAAALEYAEEAGRPFPSPARIKMAKDKLRSAAVALATQTDSGDEYSW